MRLALTLLLIVLLAACSAEQIYDSAQAMEQSRCDREPANLYRECVERHDTSYREYTEQRTRKEDEQP